MRGVLICIISVWMVGCSPVSVPPLSTYTLSPLKAPSPSGYHSSQKILLLNTVTADSGFNTNKMLYVNIPYKLKAFVNNAWVAPPASMLQSLLASSLRQKHFFSAVVTPPYSGYSDFVVSAKLLVLQQEFLRPISQERLAIAVSVINAKTNRVIGEKIFEKALPAPENDPYGGVLAANKAASMLSARAASYIVKVSS